MSVKKLEARTSTKFEMKIIAKALSKLSSCLLNFFSPTYHGSISNLSAVLEVLYHGGANKIVCSLVEAEFF